MDSPLHTAARRWHGVLLTRQAVELGYSPDFFRRLVRTEVWQRLFRGAYLLPGYELCLRVYVAAVQARWPQFVASHATAGSLWQLAGCAERLEFTGPPTSRNSLPCGRYARDQLVDADTHYLAGLRVTTPTRTVVDLLLTQSRDGAVMALDSALCAELTSLPAVAESLESRSAHDPRIAAAWRAFHLADPAAESPVETKARLGLTDAGLAVRSQVRVRVGDRIRRVDLLVEGCVLFEAEGATYHRNDPAGQHRFVCARLLASSVSYRAVADRGTATTGPRLLTARTGSGSRRRGRRRTAALGSGRTAGRARGR